MLNNVKSSSQPSAPPVALVPPTTINHAVVKPVVAPIVTRKSSLSGEKPAEPSLPTAIVPPVTNTVPVRESSPIKKEDRVPTPVPTNFSTTLEQSLANLEEDMLLTNDLKSELKIKPISTNVASHVPPIMTNSVPNAMVNNSSANYLQPVIQHPPLATLPEVKPQSMNMIPNSLMSTIEQDISFLPQSTTTTTPVANMIHSNNNGFPPKQEFDMNTNNNSLPMSGTSMGVAMPSLFDPQPLPVPKPSVLKEPLLQPKPIEELIESIPGFIPGMYLNKFYDYHNCCLINNK